MQSVVLGIVIPPSIPTITVENQLTLLRLATKLAKKSIWQYPTFAYLNEILQKNGGPQSNPAFPYPSRLSAQQEDSLSQLAKQPITTTDALVEQVEKAEAQTVTLSKAHKYIKERVSSRLSCSLRSTDNNLNFFRKVIWWRAIQNCKGRDLQSDHQRGTQDPHHLVLYDGLTRRQVQNLRWPI